MYIRNGCGQRGNAVVDLKEMILYTTDNLNNDQLS